jgi:hypothetical protein
MVLSTVMRIKRTLDGAEIDKIIWDVEAPQGTGARTPRRADWQRRELSVRTFQADGKSRE